MIEDLSMTTSQTPLDEALFHPHFIDQEPWGSALIFEAPYCSAVRLCLTPWTAAHQASLSFTISLSFAKTHVHGRWDHPAISSSVIPFSSCPQSFPASGSFPVSQLFASGDQSIGVSASASVLPMNIQGWLPLGSTGLISLKHLLYPVPGIMGTMVMRTDLLTSKGLVLFGGQVDADKEDIVNEHFQYV